MFNTKPVEKTTLEEAIEELLLAMRATEEDSTEYAQMADQLVKLHALKINEIKPRVSPDTLATIAANLGGIFIIVAYEQKHLVTTKALTFLRKLG